jgi:hypothetical protein
MRGESRKWVWLLRSREDPGGFAVGLAQVAIGGAGDQAAGGR